jgi:alpha-glucosidase
MLIQKLVYVLKAIGIRGIFRTIQYGLYRDRIEKQQSPSNDEAQDITPGNALKTQPIQGGIQIDFKNANLELIFISENIIRISWTPGRPPVPCTITKNDWEIPDPTVSHENSSHRISLGNYEVNIDADGEISIGEINGNVLRRDKPPILKGKGWNLSTVLLPEERIYGLGERASNFNLRPGIYKSWNTDASGSYSTGDDPIYICTPIYLSHSSRGNYLVYYENSYPSEFVIKDMLQSFFTGGMLRYYVFVGSLQTIYAQLCELTGYPYMPPRWVLGYHQSRWGYKSEADIRSLVRKFEEHNLPLSAIHLDIDYMDSYRIFSINRKNFPSMKRLANDLQMKGIKLIASINPAVKRDRKYTVYSNGLSKKVFCTLPNGQLFTGVSWPGWSVFPDFTSNEACEWWQEQYSSLLDEGISGIWHDMNEPSSFAAWGDKTFPSNVCHSMMGLEGDHREAHNLYGLLMNKAGYKGIQNHSPEKRPWIFSRAGWAGLQHYAWNWTGDIESTWEALHQTVPMILGLSLSGHYFSGADIGGFSGDPSAELYLRWFQLSCFLPLLRTHSAVGTKPREPWVFGEPITTIIQKFLQLRYKLIPYFYSIAWEAVQKGIPVIRPIFWDEPQNEILWDLSDEFMLGPSLLIAPILYKDADTRSVFLPKGKWVSFWNDQEYHGSTKYDIHVDRVTIPIFIKGGSIIPMEENNQFYLHIYPMDKGESITQIYLDNGDGYGDWRLDTFYSNYSPDSAEISWRKSGKYPFPHRMINIQIHGEKPIIVTIDNEKYTFQDEIITSPVFQKLKIYF